MSSQQSLPIDASNRLTVLQKNGKIWSHIRQKWLIGTPEERVRQAYLCVLVNEYEFTLAQMGEEVEVTGRGAGHARADFVIWRTLEDKLEDHNPLIVVECKSDNVTIRSEDYGQGDNYARLTGARFLVTHNTRETKYWRVVHQKMPKTLEEIENIPHADASDKEIEDLITKLKVFKEREFADLLHQCHNVIRNREKKDPAAAFDEIAKILFIKVWVERELQAKRSRRNIFTVETLDSQLGDNPLDDLFQKTKAFYRADQIFGEEERINLKPATGREIVKRLERYNLSDTSEDVKGIAFERFLGRTFRGEIGQFFTPRPIVEFMVRMVDPSEGDVICDPASGSGGFLIRFFEMVRQEILADVDRQYHEYRAHLLNSSSNPEEEKADLLRTKFDELQNTIAPSRQGSRLWALANRCIYGTDANERMARTSKMNMIMHGDGHGGVHFHDGFLNVNGIFEERFDIVLTNPPFGANVEPSDVILESDVLVPEDVERRYETEYGDRYRQAQARVRAAQGKPIASLFALPKSDKSKVKTEILFLERCLALLKPGGRMGIVLPEGVFNNPSLAYVREFCEDRAFIRAVVSLPQETFYSSGATVKASLLFLQKFTDTEQDEFDLVKKITRAEIDEKYAVEIGAEQSRLEEEIVAAKMAGDAERRRTARKALRDYLQGMEQRKRSEARAQLKERFSYLVFLYDAEKVGITATGEEDENELYPNDRAPQKVKKSCLELYRKFLNDPETFLDGRLQV